VHAPAVHDEEDRILEEKKGYGVCITGWRAVDQQEAGDRPEPIPRGPG